MKLSIPQFMTFAFMLGWVGTDFLNGADLFESMNYHDRVYISGFLAFIAGYLNNAHGLMWEKLKKMSKRKY